MGELLVQPYMLTNMSWQLGDKFNITKFKVFIVIYYQCISANIIYIIPLSRAQLKIHVSTTPILFLTMKAKLLDDTTNYIYLTLTLKAV